MKNIIIGALLAATLSCGGGALLAQNSDRTDYSKIPNYCAEQAFRFAKKRYDSNIANISDAPGSRRWNDRKRVLDGQRRNWESQALRSCSISIQRNPYMPWNG